MTTSDTFLFAILIIAGILALWYAFNFIAGIIEAMYDYEIYSYPYFIIVALIYILMYKGVFEYQGFHMIIGIGLFLLFLFYNIYRSSFLGGIFITIFSFLFVPFMMLIGILIYMMIASLFNNSSSNN
jgi:hypothetical protein